MKTLLIQNIASLVSCDEEDRVYENVDLYAENGVIRAIGQNLDKAADETIDTTISISSFPAICRRCRTWSCLTG